MDDATAERLRRLLEAWFAAVESGQQPEFGAICRDDPDLIPTLRRLVAQEADAGELLARGDAVPPTPPADTPPPERVGDFTLLELLGTGGMGAVYLARQESLRRLVAVKLLRKDATRDAHALLRFRREAEIAASLEHPNIVPVYAVGEEGGQAYLAMKRLAGPGLEQLAGRLDVREAARIGAAVAHALHAAHSAGIVHRDIKPGNVMMDGAEPCILDFGLARVGSDPRLTRQGAVAGTLPYMSPEQLRGADVPKDARSDVYSLGVTLYELVSGRCPFATTDPEIAIHAILFREPATMGLRGAARDFETIVLRALDKDPARRFASAAAMAEELERFHDGRAITSRRIGFLGRAFRLARRRPGTAVTVTGLGLASLGLAGILAVRGLRDAAEITADLATIERRIEAGELAAARSLAEKLGSRAPRDPRVVELTARLDAITRLDDLLDLLQDRAESAEPGTIDELLAKLDGEAVFASDLRRARLLEIARVLSAFGRGHSSEAADGYDRLGPSPHLPRATRTLASVLGRPVAPEVVTPDPKDGDDLALASIVHRYGGRPVEEILAALLEGHATGYRVSFGLGVAYAMLETADGNARAEIAFRLGAIRDGDHPTAVLRNLARLALIDGDFARAHAWLAELVRKNGTATPKNPAEAAIRADLALREGRMADAEAMVHEAAGRWPTSPDLLWRWGKLHFEAGNYAAAASCCDRAAEGALARGAPRLRDRARVSAFVARATSTLTTRPTAPPSDPGRRLDAVVREAEGLRRRSRSRLASRDRSLARPPFPSRRPRPRPEAPRRGGRRGSPVSRRPPPAGPRPRPGPRRVPAAPAVGQPRRRDPG